MLAVEAEGLVKFFGQVAALRGLSMKAPGGVSGLIGPNGAGKTTTIHILAGLVRPTRGSARVLGFDAVRESTEVRRRARFVLEDQELPRHRKSGASWSTQPASVEASLVMREMP